MIEYILTLILIMDSAIVLCMTSHGHPEDQLVGKTIVYTGQDKNKKNDNVIPTASVLLYFHQKEGYYRAFKIVFHRQLRVRNEPDSRNLGVISYRPLFEFYIVEELQTIEIPPIYKATLEDKVSALLSFGFLCKYNRIDIGILPCEKIVNLPNLYDPRILKWWRKNKLVSLILECIE